jgi:NAD-dependent DNA ligase
MPKFPMRQNRTTIKPNRRVIDSDVIDDPWTGIDTGNLKNEIFVLTGTLSKTRDEFQKLIEKHGGTVSSVMGNAGKILVAGPDAVRERTAKITRAERLGAQIISEKKLLDMICK